LNSSSLCGPYQNVDLQTKRNYLNSMAGKILLEVVVEESLHDPCRFDSSNLEKGEDVS